MSVNIDRPRHIEVTQPKQADAETRYGKHVVNVTDRDGCIISILCLSIASAEAAAAAINAAIGGKA
jgi:hypothetical protein